MKKFCAILFLFLFSFGTTALLTAVFFYKLDNLPAYQNKNPQEWMIKQIHSDLNNIEFQESYPQFEEQVKKYKIAIGKITIKEGVISYDVVKSSDNVSGSMNNANYKRFMIHVNKLRNLIKKGAVFSNTTFYLYSFDAPNWSGKGKKFIDILDEIKEKPPIFVNAVRKNDQKKHNFILLPDDYVVANRKLGYWIGWNLLSKKIMQYNREMPWEKKINKALWRGKAGKEERLRTIDMSSKFPNYIDSKNTLHQVTKPKILKSIYELLAMQFSLSNFMSKKDQIKYKMLINMDGCTCTYPGFLWRLLSNSVTLKQETDEIQWFYPALKPWVHYIPVKRDMSDLVERVKWVLNNEKEAKKIADESTKFVKENLMIEDVDTYIVTLLNEYARLRDSQLKSGKKAA